MLTCILLAGQIWLSDGTHMAALTNVGTASIYNGRVVIRTPSDPLPLGGRVSGDADVADIVSEALAPCTDTPSED